MRLIVGISGSSGAVYGVRVLEVLRDLSGVETHLVMTGSAKMTLGMETGRTVGDVEALAHHAYDHRDLAGAISSGSFKTDGMIRILRFFRNPSFTCFSVKILVKASRFTVELIVWLTLASDSNRRALSRSCS